jgi:hypothetical protein
MSLNLPLFDQPIHGLRSCLDLWRVKKRPLPPAAAVVVIEAKTGSHCGDARLSTPLGRLAGRTSR